ncbi:retrovirus-related pol polyprotein from transposon TNT 1-94 [Tanacetum coccineum]
MFKLDIEAISLSLKNNRDAHEVYIDKTIEYTDTLRGFVESTRTRNPSEPLLESACMFTKHVQELLVYASQTCLNSTKPSEKLVVVTLTNKNKRPLLTSTEVKPTTSASGSKPSGNTKNNRISRPPCSNQKNKVEDHPRTVKSSLNKMNSISEPISNALVKHFVINAKFESVCAICNKCLCDANHDMCLVDFVNDVNVSSKSKSKRNKKRKAWKSTGKVFTDVGFKWKLTGKIFTIVGNSCPLTRFTPKNIVHLKKTTPKSAETSKPDIKVYSRRPKQIKSVDVPYSLVNDRLSRSSSGTVRFGNDQVAKIMGYGDYQQGNQEKHSHKTKAEDSSRKTLSAAYGSCGPMLRTQKLFNGRKLHSGYFVDDYSQVNWVKISMIQRMKVSEFMIKFLKMIQVHLNATVHNMRTDNGTKFVNHTLNAYYEEVRISHQTSMAVLPPTE